MTAPANNASYSAPASITITTDAQDADGTVTNVEYYANDIRIGSARTSPFSYTWTAVPAGSYSLKAKAIDNRGTYSWSAPIMVGVDAGSGGPPYAGLALWLKADAGVTLNSTNGRVATWADQSGQGRNAVQAIAASQPALVTTTLGQAGIRLDGVDDFLTFSLPVNGLNEITIFLVANNLVDRDGAGGNYSALFWNQTETDGRLFLSPFQSRVNFRFGTKAPNNNPVYLRPASIADDLSVTVARKDGATDSLYVNGAEVWMNEFASSPIAGCADVGNVGRGYNNSTYFAGEVAEVLVYTRALPQATRESIEQYLKTKWISNLRPTVTLDVPTSNAAFSSPANVSLAASAADSDGTVTNVEFYADSTLIGSDKSSPFSLVWSNPPPGTYLVTAKAIDNKGAYRSSAAAEILVSTTGGSFTPSATALGNTTNNFNLNELGRAGWGALGTSRHLWAVRSQLSRGSDQRRHAGRHRRDSRCGGRSNYESLYQPLERMAELEGGQRPRSHLEQRGDQHRLFFHGSGRYQPAHALRLLRWARDRQREQPPSHAPRTHHRRVGTRLCGCAGHRRHEHESLHHHL